MGYDSLRIKVNEYVEDKDKQDEEYRRFIEDYAKADDFIEDAAKLDREVRDAADAVKQDFDTEKAIQNDLNAELESKRNSLVDELNQEYQKLEEGNDILSRSSGTQYSNNLDALSREISTSKDSLDELFERLDAEASGNSGKINEASADASDSLTAGTDSFLRDIWDSMENNIDEQIDNYREALHSRGVPDCNWLDNTMEKHRNNMLMQEQAEMNDPTGQYDYYAYPSDYSAFYDSLAGQFFSHCLSGTNPNNKNGPEWKDNCQRCVVAYEMRCRGMDVQAYPSTHGSDHLAFHPFDAWENPSVINCYNGGGLQEIEDKMAQWGDGARAQIVVIWNGWGVGGHTFIAERRSGRTFFVDPQTNNHDVRDYFMDVVPGMTQFCRIDNLQTSAHRKDCYF